MTWDDDGYPVIGARGGEARPLPTLGPHMTAASTTPPEPEARPAGEELS